jgi:glycosyltransferase involved in cell wall biosynthesis
MSLSRPLFSIITVTYNAESTISPTMLSVAEQSCTLYEHIIMDGASTDSTVKIANKLASNKTIIHSAPDNGIYDAMNKGMDIATGDYLIFLNAGDRFHSPDTLQELADAIMANDYPGIVYGQTQLVDINNNYIGPRHLTAPDILTFDSFKHGMLVCHQAFTVLRKVAPRYDTRWRLSADYEWCIRCLKRSRRNVYTHSTTINYLSEGMTTKYRRKSLIERYKIMSHYYGILPTFMRHIAFIPRFIKTTILKK